MMAIQEKGYLRPVLPEVRWEWATRFRAEKSKRIFVEGKRGKTSVPIADGLQTLKVFREKNRNKESQSQTTLWPAGLGKKFQGGTRRGTGSAKSA